MNYLIDFADNLTDDEISAYMTENAMTIVKSFDSFHKVFLVSADAEPTVNEKVVAVIHDDENGIKLLGFTDTYPESQLPTIDIDMHAPENWWKMASIYSPNFDSNLEVHELRGSNFAIYLMDSGILSTHPELDTADISQLYSFTGDFTDTNGHGTALASIMVGKTCGLTNARIKDVKIFDKNVATKQSDILSALDAIISDFRNAGSMPSIVNMSWNISKNVYIENKINAMIQEGILVVAAAGNDGHAIDDITPASIPLVITVGAYGQNLEPCNFSNYTGGSAISYTAQPNNTGALDGWAPGEMINAATLDGKVALVAGTSTSAAIHSASLAYNLGYLLMSNGDFAPDLVIEDLIAWAKYMSFAKPNLLTLGSVYDNSPNRITTYFTHPGDRKNLTGGEYIFVVGKQQSQYLFDCTNIKEISSDADLPAGLSIDNGKLTGTPSNITSDYEFHAINLALTLLDNTVENYQLRVAVLQPTVDLDTAVEGTDPTLDLILAICADCCPNAGRTGCVEGSPGCSSSTGGVHPTCNYSLDGSKSIVCNCV